MDLLEIRLNETKLFNQPVTTVVVCAGETHTGKPKDTYVKDIKSFDGLGLDIFCYALDKLAGKTPREKEADQRNKIKEALFLLNPTDNDIILISDVDEIPRARQINLFSTEINFAALIQDKYAYYLNWIESEQSWDRARIMTWRYLVDKEPEKVRNSGYDFSLHHAGWHWSWVCDPERKLASFSHNELYSPESAERVRQKENIWNNEKFVEVEINLSHPEYLYRNKEKFSSIISPPQTNEIF